MLRAANAYSGLSASRFALPWRTAEETQKNELAALLELCNARLLRPRDLVAAAQGAKLYSIIELGGDESSVRWAVTEPDSLAPGGSWGTLGQIVRMKSDQPLPELPTAWPSTEVSLLRTTPFGFVELRLSEQCDGAVDRFGERAWSEVLNAVPGLAERLAGDQPIRRLSYSDRYIRSPLALRLLFEFLRHLKTLAGGIGENTEVSIATSQLQRNDTREPFLFQHDWRDAQDRNSARRELFNSLGNVRFTESQNRHLPHARELILEWEGYTPWVVRLDQGVGYWRIPNRQRVTFPFRLGMTEQVKALSNAALRVEGGGQDHPTYWYLGNIEP